METLRSERCRRTRHVLFEYIGTLHYRTPAETKKSNRALFMIMIKNKGYNDDDNNNVITVTALHCTDMTSYYTLSSASPCIFLAV